ncbi:MAG: hydratase [Christensenellaceae bacterium]|jgi:aconitate hydratase|nr:hydratase [Christensenellaceae bacterium]
MLRIKNEGVIYHSCNGICDADPGIDKNEARKKTIAYKIIAAHNVGGLENTNNLRLKADAVTSHDITYVGIIQTARAAGLKSFPIPYILTNCHNSLCAVGGTINEDDHVFGLSATKKYGGIYVPPHFAVIHTYMREMFAGCGKIIIGSDSHTRYGALGTLAIGEGGPEIVKQLLGQTYDISNPDVICVHLTGRLRSGVGPQDVALALIRQTFKAGIVKNKILEFVGAGVRGLPIEFRNGIDVMTTETACLSSIWETDEQTQAYLHAHGRGEEYKKLAPVDGAYYDGCIEIDLSSINPMIALPFHPSEAYEIDELLYAPHKILAKYSEDGRKLTNVSTFDLTSKITKDGMIKVDQAVIAGCAGGTYDNIFEASRILKGIKGTTIPASVYCGSQAIYLDLLKKGVIADLTRAGVVTKTSFCGPCFGAGDVPQNNGLSIRHTTRNFPSREGSKPSDRQIASVALMDARSIAASIAAGGVITSARSIQYDLSIPPFEFDKSVYQGKVYNGTLKPDPQCELVYGPNIADWPEQLPLAETIIMKVATVINDEVTTTDELIPSGETSSYRSNPLRLAEFTLSRKDPEYVQFAKSIFKDEKTRRETGNLTAEYTSVLKKTDIKPNSISIGSVIVAKKPGDGSAREQAASCQRVLGGIANIAIEYATKRYRSNLINWGMLPYRFDGKFEFKKGDYIVVDKVSDGLYSGSSDAIVVRDSKIYNIKLYIDATTSDEKDIIIAGCLINRDRQDNAKKNKK